MFWQVTLIGVVVRSLAWVFSLTNPTVRKVSWKVESMSNQQLSDALIYVNPNQPEEWK